MVEEQRYNWLMQAERHEEKEEWCEAIECYKNAIANRESIEGELEELKVIDIYEYKLHNYKMANIWCMVLPKPFMPKLSTGMLLHRNLWQQAFTRTKKEIEDGLDWVENEFSNYGGTFDYDSFINGSINLLDALNVMMKVLGKACNEIDKVSAMDNLEDYLKDIRNTIDEIVSHKQIYDTYEPSTPKEEINIWPNMPNNHTENMEHWQQELEERCKAYIEEEKKNVCRGLDATLSR